MSEEPPTRRRARPWTAKDRQVVRDNPRETAPALGRLLGRSPASVRMARRRWGLCRRPDPLDPAAVARLHAEGLSDRAIGARLGRAGSVANFARARLGLAANHAPPAPRPFTPAEDAKARRMLARGMTYAEIGRRLGRGKSAVRTRLVKLDLAEEARLVAREESA